MATLILGAMIGATSGAGIRARVSESLGPADGFIVQREAAHDPSGLPLVVESVMYSGTQTLVTVSLPRDFQAGRPWLNRTAIESDVLGHPLAVTAGQNQTVLMFRPLREGESPREIRIVLSATEVRAADSSLRNVGPWTLRLETPDPNQLRAALRTEKLRGTLSVGSARLTVDVIRSNTETVVTYDGPPEAFEARSATLVPHAGTETVSYESTESDGRVVARFQATPFGTPLSLEVGPFELPGNGDGRSLPIATGRGNSSGSYSVGWRAQNAGEFLNLSIRSIPGPLGKTINVLDIAVEGSWVPGLAEIKVVTQAGIQLETLATEVNYRKNESGATVRHNSTVSVHLPDTMPDRLIVKFPAASIFVPQRHLTLVPEGG